MEIRDTGFEGLFEIHPRVFPDNRGFFLETYRESFLKENGLPINFVQDNQSFSHKNVVRGLHMQLDPFEQIKLVRVVHGKILDVAVDIRPGSSTYGKYYSVILDGKLGNMLYIPEGFLHGFAALEESVVSYKCSSYYNNASETGILWNDPDLSIDWKVENPIVSEKDEELPTFEQFRKKHEAIN